MDRHFKWSFVADTHFFRFSFHKLLLPVAILLTVMIRTTKSWRSCLPIGKHNSNFKPTVRNYKSFAATSISNSWFSKARTYLHRKPIGSRSFSKHASPLFVASSDSSHKHQYQDKETVVTTTPITESDDETCTIKWKRFSQIKREMALCIEMHDIDKALALYEEIHDKVHQHGNIDTVLMFLSICQHANQINIVLEVIENLKRHNIVICEQVYFSLIRCYCDANRIDDAWETVKSMEGLGVEPRLRTFQPILEACERMNNMSCTLRVFDHLINVHLPPRSEQLTALLRSYAQYSLSVEKSCKNDPHRQKNLEQIKHKVNDILKQASSHLMGFPTEELERIVSTAANLSLDEVRHLGILVESLEDIDGPVISDESLDKDGSVIALNATYNSTGRLLDQYTPTPNHPHLPIGLKVEGIHFIPQKFVVWSEKSSQFSSSRGFVDSNSSSHSISSDSDSDSNSDVVSSMITSDSESVDVHSDNSGNNSVSARRSASHYFAAPSSSSSMIVLKNKQGALEDTLRARLVHISDKSCRCPHCHAKILNIPMSDEEKKEVREALIRTAAEQSLTHISHLENFAQWLQSRPEYDYIIDGPNVAYQNQNHFYGRFSYRQAMGKRPLVILPSIYSKGNYVIRNSIRRSGAVKKIMLTDPEKEFLDRLDREDMLYAVPRGANDDWYWMYSTLYPGRKTQAFVVTNDLMRDHKVSFLAPSSFIRWRTSQIVYYSISRNYNQSMWSNTLNASTLTGIVDVDKDLFLHHSLSDPNGGNLPTLNDMKIDGEVEFFGPGNFSREIQYSEDSNRWHIPALGSNLWMCLDM